MRTVLLLTAFTLALTSGAIVAQPANPDGHTPAVAGRGTNPAAPVAGSNSFTAGQAKSKIESNGFANVSGLQKDSQGVWRGTATKDGKNVKVSLDFQGNVTAQ
jgi:putative membrane protein